MELTTIARRNNPFRKLGGRIARSKYLLLMIFPAIIFYAIFNYVPMYGVLMAFQKFNPKLGIFGSSYIGFQNFQKVFEEPKFWLAFRNTLIIGSVKIVISFLGAVIIALLLNGEQHLFEGIVKGDILTEKRGSEGFGYDPVFSPEQYSESFAELGAEVKNKISHRARAVAKLVEYLNK